MNCRRSQRPAGFTLIEVVISAALMALILVSAYLCLKAGLSSQKLIEPRADVFQNARVAMALLTADLRDACPLSPETPFLGMHRTLGRMEADNLDFATHNYTPRHPHEGDFCEVSFYLDKNPQTGGFSLWRRRNPRMALDPLAGGSREEIATGLVGVRFEYFDGLDWYDDWGSAVSATSSGNVVNTQAAQAGTGGMPEAVRVTLLFSSEPGSKPVSDPEAPLAAPPLVFQTVVRLALADRPQAGSSGGPSNGGASTSGTPTPGT